MVKTHRFIVEHGQWLWDTIIFGESCQRLQQSKKQILLTSIHVCTRLNYKTKLEAYIVVTEEHVLQCLTEHYLAAIQFGWLLFWLRFLRFGRCCTFCLLGQTFSACQCCDDPVVEIFGQVPEIIDVWLLNVLPLHELTTNDRTNKCTYIRGRCRAPTLDQTIDTSTWHAGSDTRSMC